MAKPKNLFQYFCRKYLAADKSHKYSDIYRRLGWSRQRAHNYLKIGRMPHEKLWPLLRRAIKMERKEFWSLVLSYLDPVD